MSADLVFQGITGLCAASIVGLVVLIAIDLWIGARMSRQAFGLSFIWHTTWDPIKQVFGALPYLFGTVETSLIALAIGGPIGVGVAIFLAEIAPRSIRSPVSLLVEMLATIPSVVYGLWALFVLVPVVRGLIEPFLNTLFGALPMFQGPKYGVGVLSAGLVLAIMILPTIAAVSRDIISTVPREQREGLIALGATRWEVISWVVLPFGRAGIMGAIILGLGRALGETMAVTMVIGNRGQLSGSLFSLGDTMASVIANQFTEASYPLYVSALIEVGLLLFGVTMVLNVLARLLVWRMAGNLSARVVG